MDKQMSWKTSPEERFAVRAEQHGVGNIWGQIAQVAIPVASSILGGLLGDDGEEKAAKAQEKAANDVTALQKDIYLDQRGLASPGYLTGGDATNALAFQSGLPQQDYAAALRGSPTSISGSGEYDWGSYFDTYLKNDPNFAGNWDQNKKLRAMFGDDRNAYAQHHYNQYGKQIGWEPKLIGGDRGQTTQPVGSPQPVGQTGATQATNPLAAFMASPQAQIATAGFRGVDVPEVDALYASSGKLLSGAKDRALDEAGKARLGGAYGDYTNALRSLAGQAQTATSQINSAAGAYGANAGNSMMAAGDAKANALRGAYDGLTRGISGAADAVIGWGDSTGWGGGGKKTTTSGASWDNIFAGKY